MMEVDARTASGPRHGRGKDRTAHRQGAGPPTGEDGRVSPGQWNDSGLQIEITPKGFSEMLVIIILLAIIVLAILFPCGNQIRRSVGHRSLNAY